MRLTYWVASHPEPRLSIRSKTRWEAQCGVGDAEDEYGPVAKVVIEYANAFDLMQQCMDGDVMTDTSLTGTGPGVVLAEELRVSPPPLIVLGDRRWTYDQAMEHARNGKLVARAWWPWNHVQLLGDHTLVYRSGQIYNPSQGGGNVEDDDQTAKDWIILEHPR